MLTNPSSNQSIPSAYPRWNRYILTAFLKLGRDSDALKHPPGGRFKEGGKAFSQLSKPSQMAVSKDNNQEGIGRIRSGQIDK